MPKKKLFHVHGNVSNRDWILIARTCDQALKEIEEAHDDDDDSIELEATQLDDCCEISSQTKVE